MSKSILETYGLNKVAVVNASVYYGKTDISGETIDSDIFLGIEVEVENHRLIDAPQKVWQDKGDNSLRNNGIEWITHPIPARWAPHALQDLLGNCLSKECCFSPRTSIHVHFNVQSMPTAHVIDITLLYAALEPLFYKYTGRGRIKNSYCVPLIDTNLLTGMNQFTLRKSLDVWSKYTGLNLVPIQELGTIEARHMHGTFDHNKVVIWIRLWTKLIEYVTRNAGGNIRRLLLSLDNTTDYQQLLTDVFGTDAGHLKFESFDKDLKHSVNVVKRAFITNAASLDKSNALSKKSPYFQMGA